MATSPPDVPNLLFWYNFAAGLQFTDFGITSASHQGDAIQQINDLSGLGNNATQTSGSKPTVDLAKQAFRFISGSFLVLPNVFTGCTQAEIFWVIQSARQDVQRGFAWFNTSDNPSHYTYSDTFIYSGFLTTARNQVGNPMTLNNRFHIYEECSHTASWFAQMDGANIYLRTNNTFQNDNTTPWIGVSRLGYTFDGWIQQVFAYSRVLNPSERDALTRTLTLSNSSSAFFAAIMPDDITPINGISSLVTGSSVTSSVVGLRQPFQLSPINKISVSGTQNSIIIARNPILVIPPGKLIPVPFPLPVITSGSITGSDFVHVPKAGQLFPLGNR